MMELEVENVCGVSLNDVVVSREIPSQPNMVAPAVLRLKTRF